MLSEAQTKCLEVLGERSYPHGEMCLWFQTIMDDTGYRRKEVRMHVRALAHKGFAEYYRGLWTEDGEPAGAGYCITKEGIAALKEAEDG